ncbi:MAG TPA: hypothetical protein DCY48_00500 [Candidatus Magasanikbacteria bacterium]|nr:MAG: hypothetical protein A3I74_02600 [Candidatus Magasanikbacteria bacterium RIFCSPLOWO2_02_FULL_47_16]OGH79607.1 MAG: hypothetical protein A3C10_00800 [Candidatus Magasanikbacteria bacterium RIFCSPHIGHO2_02_FULL_48_18]OGH82022.1 MAG: hypothetical protein A3G08_02310 [Candidatus Magasanikbacteria bacterium RIFCSPLOWO2_12_FULL_47_9b]HAZ28245.1 hypothetical protein [Candidatus Magasanikbacteria bacterium]
MYNWSTDVGELKKDPKKYTIWKLEQMVNFGLNGEKLSKVDLKKNWDLLALDPKKKQYLRFLLWNTLS